jgi:hypothetical protein
MIEPLGFRVLSFGLVSSLGSLRSCTEQDDDDDDDELVAVPCGSGMGFCSVVVENTPCDQVCSGIAGAR